jgi:tRNA A58 N-methylase Trm61
MDARETDEEREEAEESWEEAVVADVDDEDVDVVVEDSVEVEDEEEVCDVVVVDELEDVTMWLEKEMDLLVDEVVADEVVVTLVVPLSSRKWMRWACARVEKRRTAERMRRERDVEPPIGMWPSMREKEEGE